MISRFIPIGMVAIALLAGTLLWVFYFKTAQYQDEVLRAMQIDIERKWESAQTEVQNWDQVPRPSQWTLRFQGTELWVEINAAGDRQTESAIVAHLHRQFSQRPGDERRFPIFVHFNAKN